MNKYILALLDTIAGGYILLMLITLIGCVAKESVDTKFVEDILIVDIIGTLPVAWMLFRIRG